MKKTIFTLLLFSAIGLLSCRKNKVYPDIKQQDQQEILNYISTNNISGMKRDTVGGDTSGIYYEAILPGVANTSYQYTDSIAFVYTIHTFDGNYNSPDTTTNHYDDFAGHISQKGLPYGLQLVIHDVLKRGGSIRVLIPSRLAYGIGGFGTGSSLNLNSRIAGNQCIDYYIHSINDEAAYDDLVIRNFMARNNYPTFTRTASGLWYYIHTPGTGTDYTTNNTTVTMTYTSDLLSGIIWDQYNTTDGSGTALDVPDLIPGLQEGLKLQAVTTGAYVAFLIPSTLGYGKKATSGSDGSLPVNSIIHYEIRIVSVTP
jgi:FKBP-type peptidyl-prolyl cis-trans isomerase FkpA